MRAATASSPASTPLPRQVVCPDQARQAAQPAAATNQSRLSSRLQGFDSRFNKPGSSPSTRGRATIRAVTSASRRRRSTSGRRSALTGSGVPGTILDLLRLPVGDFLRLGASQGSPHPPLSPPCVRGEGRVRGLGAIESSLHLL